MIILAVGMSSIEKLFPTTAYNLFAYPAGFLISLFFSTPLAWNANHELLIPLNQQTIHIVPSCSGYGFFCMLWAMCVWHLFRRFTVPKAFLYSMLVVPAAYALTIISNSCRMVSAYQAHQITKILLPDNFQAAIHQGIGILLFLSIIMATHLYLERKFHVGYTH